MMKQKELWMMVVILVCSLWLQTSCTKEDVPALSEEQLFEQEMNAALADARVYGPITQALAEEVAAQFDGRVTELNYKTRESATRKCRTDNCRPYDLKDLARTGIAAGWDSTEIKPVISYLVTTATERGLFKRYKHQTSDYGYWGDLVNLKFERLQTEIQVKTYGMFYASFPADIVQSVLGDSIYTIIHTKSGVEPGLLHQYYEIIRADTSSTATVGHYKKLTTDYLTLCEHARN
jgi:hypothetical protein